MKKTKILLASVAVASLAVGCGIIAACGTTAKTTYDVTFDGNGGAYANEQTVTLKTDENGKLAALPDDPAFSGHEFNGYNTLANGSGDAVTVDTTYSATTTVYAQWINVYSITYVVGDYGELANNASATATTSKAKLTSIPEVTVTAEKKTFLGWYTTASGEGDEVTTAYTFTGETTSINVYARYRDEYTVTLTAGVDGTIKEGATTSFVTKNGKIDGYLPADEDVTCTKENWHFAGWLDGETDVDEREYVFTQDAELTAKYVQNNGLWNQAGTEMLASLVLNTGATSHTEYWFGIGAKHQFSENTVITIYLDGAKQENFWLTGSCVEIGDSEGGSGMHADEVTVSEDATFEVYIKLYPDGGTTFEFNGTPDRLPEINALPEGADAITITVKDPDAAGDDAVLGVITIYLVGKDGKSVQLNPEEGYDAAANYRVHAWNGSDNNLFGDWNNDNPYLNTDVVLNYAKYNKNTIFMFHDNNGWQTGNISGMELNKTYVINLQTGSAQEYVAPAGDAEY